MNPAELAARCLIRAGTDRLPVDPARLLALCPGTYVYSLPQMLRTGMAPEVLQGLTPSVPAAVFDYGAADGMARRTVVYLPDADPVRLRFSLAHEFGHIALKHRGGRTPAMEAAANRFAGLLLMPPALVRGLAREGLLYAEQLCEVFGVSLSAAMNPDLPALTPESEDGLRRLLLDAARAALPPAVSPRWHPLRIPC